MELFLPVLSVPGHRGIPSCLWHGGCHQEFLPRESSRIPGGTEAPGSSERVGSTTPGGVWGNPQDLGLMAALTAWYPTWETPVGPWGEQQFLQCPERPWEALPQVRDSLAGDTSRVQLPAHPSSSKLIPAHPSPSQFIPAHPSPWEQVKPEDAPFPLADSQEHEGKKTRNAEL